MSREAYIRGSLALMMADLFPPLIQQAIMSDEDFAAGLNLSRVGTVTFNRTGPTFSRSALMAAVRAASRTLEGKIADEAGKTWKVEFDRNHDPLRLLLVSSPETIIVNHLGVVSDNLEDRIAVLDAEGKRVNLPAGSRQNWATILSDRALTEDEVDAFVFDINATPSSVRAAIAGTLRDENVPIDVLVPRALVYYERLVGRISRQITFSQYADEVLPGHMTQLLAWDSEEGMKQCLLLCTHPRVVDILAQLDWDVGSYSKVVSWSVNECDALARCAVIELSILRADTDGDIAKGLAAAATALVDDKKNEQFEILSALFIMVYGQLARTKVLAGKPTFWRRLAALAHAAVVARCLGPSKDHHADLAVTFQRARSRPFFCQVYADLRSGPLWQGQSAMSGQLKNEFVGRLIHRAAERPNETRTLGLEECVLTDGRASLKSAVDLYLTMLPGPLEDNVPLEREMPEETYETVATSLRDEKPTGHSFEPLLSTTFVFRQPPELVNLAVAALQRAQFHIDITASGIAIGPFITALASVAAISRNVALADSVLSLIRNHRYRVPSDLDISEATRAGIVACASRRELPEWCAAVGDLMSEFAFQSLSNDEAAGLHSFLIEFCDLVPELWASCGPAMAAFEAVMSA